MSEHDTVWIPRHPGDLVTAADWNQLQRDIRNDIETTASDAAAGVTHVASADDAGQLGGMDLDALSDEIARRVLSQVQAESGYRRVFRVLEEGTIDDPEFDVIEHGLGTCPLVDVYRLEHFEVACREDDLTYATIATFYLHHTSERQVRVADDGGNVRRIDVQPDNRPHLLVPFAEMLRLHEVEYSDDSSLEDVEVEFWEAFFSEPNDRFHDDQYCHSPWFERCCRDQRSVESIKSSGDWDDIWFQARPWKVVTGPAEAIPTNEDDGEAITGYYFPDVPVPSNVAVAHLDLDRVALWLTGEALHGELYEGHDLRADGDPTDGTSQPRDGGSHDALLDEFDDQLKVMVLLHA